MTLKRVAVGAVALLVLLAALVLAMNFRGEDRIPDREFTEVIWKAVKGEHSIVPAPRRAAFVKLNEMEEDDDD